MALLMGTHNIKWLVSSNIVYVTIFDYLLDMYSVSLPYQIAYGYYSFTKVVKEITPAQT